MSKKDEFTKNQLKYMGERMRELRKANGYSNYELFAFDHEIARSQYGKYEKGEDLRISSLIKVLKALDISLLDFFNDTRFNKK